MMFMPELAIYMIPFLTIVRDFHLNGKLDVVGRNHKTFHYQGHILS